MLESPFKGWRLSIEQMLKDKIFGPKNFWFEKNFGPIKLLVQKFWAIKILGLKAEEILGPH